MSEATHRALSEIHPFGPDVLACPHLYNRRLRAEAPVYHCPHTGVVFVSDYDTVVRVAKDHETFSNRFAAAMRSDGEVDPEIAAIQQQGWPPVDTMLTQDPPEHRRYRLLVNEAFTARRVRQMEPDIERLAHELIDGFAADGRCEFIAAFCVPLPLTVIAEQLGVPVADMGLFKKWSDAFVAQFSRTVGREEQIEAARLILEFQRYFAAKLEERRASPRDDILSDLVNARIEGERPLDTAEMLSILQQLLVAGNETTTSAIAEGLFLLMREPEQMALVREDPGLVSNLVEEVLRLSSPTANMWRVATRDVELGGVSVPAGSLLQLRYASANRDAAQYPDPERFDVRRENAKSNVAFGHGVHMCIGASLARKEMNVAFRVLLERLEGFELDCDPSELEWQPNVLLRGLKTLPVRFRERAAA